MQARPAAPMLPVTDQRSIASLLRPLLRQASAELILFGSGAGGDARLASDVDIAVRAAQPLPPDLLAAARQSLEDSNVPFNVDLLDYATLSDELKQAIDREGIAWPV